jgi:hypothetical protein
MLAPVFVGLLCLVGQQPTPIPPSPFTAAHFREHVAYLASDELGGRQVATEGNAKALDYLVRHFKASGATGLAAGGEWFQPFVLRTGVRPLPECSLSSDSASRFTLSRDFVPAPWSADGHVEGELAFVGYAVSNAKHGYDDFAGVALKGKVAVALAGIPDTLAKTIVRTGSNVEECERHGAAALIVVLGDRSGIHVDFQLPPDTRTERIPIVLVSRDAANRLLPQIDREKDALSALEKALAAPKPQPQSRNLGRTVRLEVHLERKPMLGRNLLAVVPGKGELAREAVIVSAHHDHLGTDLESVKAGKDGIYNGADDNASGCAAVMLLAEGLHADRDQLPASYRTVIFASFDAEEWGLIGSRYYVNHPLWPLGHTAVNINFDQIGRLEGRPLMAMDSTSNAFLAERVPVLAAACGLRVETRLHGAGRSDHQNFLLQSIPAVHFTSGLHPDYHQVTDEVSKVDCPGGARISWLAYRLLRDAMTAPGRLRYQQPPPTFDVQRILRLVIKLGIFPEQNAQSGRAALVRDVIPGSVAAKHGMKGGDEIIGVNGKQFESLLEGALALSRIRFDRDLRLSVRRQGKILEITLPADVFKDFVGPTVRPLDNGRFEVLFRFKPPRKVESVTLAGTFNNWDLKKQPLQGPERDGTFTARVILAKGTYEYKFVVDGKSWEADPTNLNTAGPTGNSFITVEAAP